MASLRALNNFLSLLGPTEEPLLLSACGSSKTALTQSLEKYITLLCSPRLVPFSTIDLLLQAVVCAAYPHSTFSTRTACQYSERLLSTIVRNTIIKRLTLRLKLKLKGALRSEDFTNDKSNGVEAEVRLGKTITRLHHLFNDECMESTGLKHSFRSISIMSDLEMTSLTTKKFFGDYIVLAVADELKTIQTHPLAQNVANSFRSSLLFTNESDATLLLTFSHLECWARDPSQELSSSAKDFGPLDVRSSSSSPRDNFVFASPRSSAESPRSPGRSSHSVSSGGVSESPDMDKSTDSVTKDMEEHTGLSRLSSISLPMDLSKVAAAAPLSPRRRQKRLTVSPRVSERGCMSSTSRMRKPFPSGEISTTPSPRGQLSDYLVENITALGVTLSAMWPDIASWLRKHKVKEIKGAKVKKAKVPPQIQALVVAQSAIPRNLLSPLTLQCDSIHSCVYADLTETDVIPWFAKPVMGWTIQEVGEWLANAGMAELKDNFAHNLVDGKKAMSLVRKVNVLANDSYSQVEDPFQDSSFQTKQEQIEALQIMCKRLALVGGRAPFRGSASQWSEL